MGLFSKIKNLTRSIGHNVVDPGHIVFKDGSSGSSAAPAAAADPNAGIDPNAQYYGDQSDPAYGSLLQPFGVEQFYQYEDPGYAFRQQQGMQAIQNSAAADSGALSGATLKSLLDWNQQAASQEYNNAFNRYQTQQGNIFSRLSSIAQLGQNAAANVGSQGTNLAGNAGQAYTNAGSAAGAGIVGAGNALAGGATNYWLYGTPQGRALWQPNTGGV